MNELERLCIHCKKNLLSKKAFVQGKTFCKSCSNELDNKINKIKNTRKKRNNGKHEKNKRGGSIDPVVEGRLRRDKFGHFQTTMGTAWGIRKKKISKKRLLELKKKYEPERYANTSDST